MLKILVALSLIVFGTLLADGYKDSLYLYWLLSIGVLLVIIQFLLEKIQQQQLEISEAKSKVSTLSILKGNNTNILQISPFPKDIIIEKIESKIDVFVTSAIPLSEVPQIKLLTKTEWDIKVSNQTQRGEEFGNNFEYVLRNSFVENKDNKFFRYSFYVKFNDSGEYELEIQVNNGEVDSVFKSTITVRRSGLST